MKTESITWQPAATPPDSDTTVLVSLRSGDEPVWLGYHDGDTWRDTEGFEAEVVAWAPLPEGMPG